jgi:NAD(P)-dependent dehydrogenase (short-subunit alcohol dehydrogenase family)
MATFDGLRAIVTGGASGIGLATARQLARDGALVGILDLADNGPDGYPFAQASIADAAAVQAGITTLTDDLGGLDILVNNAGIGAQGSVETNDDAEWARVLDINVTGPARVSRAALPVLRNSEHAAIVNVSSVAATIGLPQRALYSASKGAVLSLTLAMATDLLPERIRVNAVLPGTADTPWIGRLLDTAADPAAERAALEARQPHGRLVDPIEVADAICYLASPASGSTTGTWLTVDGGLTRLRPRPRP